MTWIDLDYGMRVAAELRRVEVRRVKQSRKHALGRGAAVDGESRELADAVACRTQAIDIGAIKLVRRLPLIGIHADADGSHDLTLIVCNERQYPRSPLADRYGVAAPRVFLLDEVKGIAVGVSTLGNPDLERALDGL